jgi:hypothetical protein
MSKKKIDIEKDYDILQNKDGDLMFNISEREGEPDKPELVYDGGEHALLLRSGSYTVILDYINPDVRQSLVKAKEVLIAEHTKTDKKNFTREYMAAVSCVEQLPEEYVCILREHEKEGTNEDADICKMCMSGEIQMSCEVCTRFNEHDDDSPEKSGWRVRQMIKQGYEDSERVVQFYADMAKDGNAGAQFELANLYMEGVGVEKNPAKAKEWYQKAAQQGHEGAIESLEKFKMNKEK